MLVVGSMVCRHEQRERRRRRATSAALRWLAACLALLLVASSLSQIGHFFLVSHTICAEHGELLELSGSAAATHVAHATNDGERRASPFASSAEASGHDHCELLASHQRQLALPAASLVAMVPAASSCALELSPVALRHPSLPTLSLAPKTSPPCASAASELLT